jgi:hypothetical protein
MSISLPLKVRADVRDATRKPLILASTLSNSSESPSAKYSFSSSWLMLTNGRTAIDGTVSCVVTVRSAGNVERRLP